jgi:hypothetical protein
MDEQLKDELLSFFANIERTMKAYNLSLTSREYIDPVMHDRNIQNINTLCNQLKEKVKKL